MNVNGLDIKNIAYAKSSGGGGSDGYTKSQVDAKINAITAIVSLSSLGLEDYNGTTLEFIAAIKTSSMAIGSMAIGGVLLSDLPEGMYSAEITVTKMTSTVINLAISSNNTAPYQWFFNYWSSGNANNVWRNYRERVLWDIQELTGIDNVDNMQELFSCIENTPNMPASAIITGLINFGTLPPGLSQGELVIHKIPNSWDFEYAAELSSTDIAPYRWYWKGNAWIPYIYTSYSTSSLSTANIDNLKDGEIYNYTGALTTLVIEDVSQTVRGGESVIYFTTGDTIDFSYPGNMKTTGETSLQPNTEYMITVRNSIMTVTAVS